MNFFTKLVTAILLISMTQVSIAAKELGEICFAGTFQNTGECVISIEATQHIKYISLNGLSQCKVTEDYNGIVLGNSYIYNDVVFYGAIDVFSSTDLSSKSLTFEVNLNTQRVQFKELGGRDVCSPVQDCESMIDFDIIECP